MENFFLEGSHSFQGGRGGDQSSPIENTKGNMES